MKKLLTLLLTVILAVGCCFGLAACNNEEGNEWAFGKDWIPCESQLDALFKLSNGTLDVAIIDSVMGAYYCSTGDYAGQIQIVENLTLAQEEYGIAGRKEDKAFVSKINEALLALANTDYANIIASYGMEESAALDANGTNPLASATDDSWNKIVNSGKIIIGYTVFAPICYEIVNDVPTKGFDVELANKVVAYLNQTYSTSLEIEWQEIDWNSKETLLAGGSIDLIWNGMTITPERSEAMCITVPYLFNKQAAIILKQDAEEIRSFMDLKDLIIGFESGSAGEAVCKK